MRHKFLWLWGITILTSICGCATFPDTDSEKVEVNLRKIGYYETHAHDVYVSGNFAYIAADSSGLQIIDISNPSSPQKVGQYNPPNTEYGQSTIHEVHIVGDRAYIAAGRGGLWIVDVSNQASPRELGNYVFNGHAWGIYTVGRYAYIAAGDGLRIIDISNPIRPCDTGFCDTTGGTKNNDIAAKRVYVADGYAYITAGKRGVRIIDVSDSTNPYEVSSYRLSNNITTGIYVAGNYAYIAGFELHIVDISDPRSPIPRGYWDPKPRPKRNREGNIIRLACGNVFRFAVDSYVVGDYAYIAGINSSVVNVSDPRKPYLVGGTWLGGESIYVAGDYAYIAGRNGLWIMELSIKPDQSTQGR